jgi:hypothetical protein
MAYNFQTGNNKIKQLTEYENVTQKFITHRINFLSCTFIFRKQFCFILSRLKIIRNGNHDNNLESHCIV